MRGLVIALFNRDGGEIQSERTVDPDLFAMRLQMFFRSIEISLGQFQSAEVGEHARGIAAVTTFRSRKVR